MQNKMADILDENQHLRYPTGSLFQIMKDFGRDFNIYIYIYMVWILNPVFISVNDKLVNGISSLVHFMLQATNG